MDYFPPSESRKRFAVSQTVILGLILVVVGVVASIFWLKYFLTQASHSSPDCPISPMRPTCPVYPICRISPKCPICPTCVRYVQCVWAKILPRASKPFSVFFRYRRFYCPAQAVLIFTFPCRRLCFPAQLALWEASLSSSTRISGGFTLQLNSYCRMFYFPVNLYRRRFHVAIRNIITGA